MPTFTALLRRSNNVGSTTFLAVPPDVMATFAPKRRVPVVVTIAGRSYRSQIACYGADFLIPVRAEIREAAGLAPGDVIDVAKKPATRRTRITGTIERVAAKRAST
jgi:hypothetical protein